MLINGFHQISRQYEWLASRNLYSHHCDNLKSHKVCEDSPYTRQVNLDVVLNNFVTVVEFFQIQKQFCVKHYLQIGAHFESMCSTHPGCTTWTDGTERWCMFFPGEQCYITLTKDILHSCIHYKSVMYYISVE
jgi:hypothetical protein